MKHEWKKHEKEFYGTNNKPIIINIPKQNYITINGKGNPNYPDFAERIGVLMSIAYPIKMNFKKSNINNIQNTQIYPFTDYSVYPLEGLWQSNDSDITNKDAYEYTIMVRQPDFITQEMFDSALAQTKKKKPNPFLDEIKFVELTDGLSVQILHIGSYDNEPESFKLMDNFIKEQGYKRDNNKIHREIYLSDARKTNPEKLKTLLRYSICKI